MVLQNATQKSQKIFVHVPSEIAAHEVEEIGKQLYKYSSCILNFLFEPSLTYQEVSKINKSNSWTLKNLPVTGVEHLLRDVKDTTISTLATEVYLLHLS